MSASSDNRPMPHARAYLVGVGAAVEARVEKRPRAGGEGLGLDLGSVSG